MSRRILSKTFKVGFTADEIGLVEAYLKKSRLSSNSHKLAKLVIDQIKIKNSTAEEKTDAVIQSYPQETFQEEKSEVEPFDPLEKFRHKLATIDDLDAVMDQFRRGLEAVQTQAIDVVLEDNARLRKENDALRMKLRASQAIK